MNDFRSDGKPSDDASSPHGGVIVLVSNLMPIKEHLLSNLAEVSN